MALLAAYSFDASDGTDASGNGYTLTTGHGNTPSFPTGHGGSGKSVHVPTIGDAYYSFCNIPGTNVLLSGTWTMMCWVSGGGTSYAAALCYGHGGSAWDNRQEIAYDSSTGTASMNVFGYSHFNDGLVTYTSGWAHLAVSYDGTSIRLYANGSLIETVSSGLSLPGGFSYGVTQFGVDGQNSGSVDDLRFYDVALTGTQISTCMGVAVGTTADPLAGPPHGAGAGLVAWAGAATGFTPLTVPGAPTAVSAVGGVGAATVTFTTPVFNGGATIDHYTITSSPGGFTTTVYP